MSELDKATIDFITDPNELRFHAENPIEEDGRIHVTPELLFAVADKIDGLRAEIARLKEENHALDQINRDIQTASVHLDEVLAELARRDEIIARLKEDAERLAEEHTDFDGYVDTCRYCGNKNTHEDDCAYVLHRALMKEINNQIGETK